MSGTQIPLSSNMVTYQGYGHNAVELTNWSTSAASVIAAGSVVEVAAALFNYSGNDTNDATSFSAITTNATAYLQLVPSGTVGSQIVTSSWTSTAPTFRDDLHGWYSSAASNIRYVAGCVKTGATSYELKFIITPRANIRHEQAESFTNLTATTMTVTGTLTTASIIVSGTTTVTGGVVENSRTLKRKVIDIGDWDMDTAAFTTVASGLTPSSIRSANVVIIDDFASFYYPLAYETAAAQGGSFVWKNDGNFVLSRITGGQFDTASFNSTSYNRGYISIEYEV